MSLTEKAKIGFVWTFAQQFGNQFIGFFVSLVLARLLLPSEFGLIGMIGVFIAIGNTIMNTGLTQSLIRSKNLNNEDYSTVFYFNIVISIVLYILIFFLAPIISNFYSQPILTSLIRVYCISFIITSFSAVQLAYLTKKLNFKTQTVVALPASIIGAIVGIVLAYSGYGVWSLVWSSLSTSLIGTILIWNFAKWKPDLYFSKSKFYLHFNFSYKLTVSALLNRIFDNIYIIVIGKYFSPMQVGYYTRAESTKQLPLNNIFNSLDQITFPMFSDIQDDNIRLKKVYKQLLVMVVFLVAPLFLFLSVMAEPIFRFLFTEKWVPAVPFFQILSLTGILYPFHAYNLNIIKVKGRSDLFLKLEIFKKVIIVIIVIATLPFGIMTMIYGQLLFSIIALFLNAHYTKEFIQYPIFQQFKDVFPSLLLAFVCSVLIYLMDRFMFLKMADFMRILSTGILILFAYLGCSYLLKFKALSDFVNLIFKKDIYVKK